MKSLPLSLENSPSRVLSLSRGRCRFRRWIRRQWRRASATSPSSTPDIHIDINIRIHIYIYTNICIDICLYIYINIYTNIYIYIFPYMYIHICVFVCVCVCVFVYNAGSLSLGRCRFRCWIRRQWRRASATSRSSTPAASSEHSAHVKASGGGCFLRTRCPCSVYRRRDAHALSFRSL